MSTLGGDRQLCISAGFSDDKEKGRTNGKWSLEFHWKRNIPWKELDKAEEKGAKRKPGEVDKQQVEKEKVKKKEEEKRKLAARKYNYSAIKSREAGSGDMGTKVSGTLRVSPWETTWTGEV